MKLESSKLGCWLKDQLLMQGQAAGPHPEKQFSLPVLRKHVFLVCLVGSGDEDMTLAAPSARGRRHWRGQLLDRLCEGFILHDESNVGKCWVEEGRA